MKKIAAERINDFGFAFANFIYDNLIPDDKREEFINNYNAINQIIVENQEILVKNLAVDFWFNDENEREVVESNFNGIIDDINSEAIGVLHNMLLSAIAA